MTDFGGGAASRGSLAADGLYKALTSNLNDTQTYPTFPPLLAFSISRDKGDCASNVRRAAGGSAPPASLPADPTVADEARRCVAQWAARGAWREGEVLRG